MTSFSQVALATAAKELRSEWRGRESLPALSQFIVLALVVANFSFDVEQSAVPRVAPGILWLALVFVLVVTASRTFSREHDEGSLEALLLTPASRAALLVGKAAAAAVVLLACEVVLLAGLGIFLGAAVLSPALWLSLALSTVGLCTIGSFFAAVAVQTRARELLLPVLLLPLCIPFVVAGGRAVQLAMTGAHADWSAFGLVLDFDILFVVAAALAARYVLDD